MFWGQHELAWMTFYEFAGRVGVKYAMPDIKTLDCWMRIGRASFWWQPRNGVALMCDRAAELHVNDDGRMHRLEGPAMRFRDGYSLWSIGGVVVDEQIVLKGDTQSTDQIRGEQNEEVKRLRIERFAGLDASADEGWRRYLKEVGAKKIDARRNEIENTQEALFRTPDGMTVLLCHCPSTARRYALERPSEITTCEQAQNWGWSGSRLRELVGPGRLIGRS